MYALIVIALFLLMLSVLGMAKWSSVLFSDARNKLGNQVVFTNWKGRTVMRSYVKPANPNTLKQQARRDLNKEAVSSYQSKVGGTDDAISEWNEIALPRQISGYNLFMKYAGKIKISVPATRTLGQDVTVTYTCPVDISTMGMFRLKDSTTLVQIRDAGELDAGDDQTYDDPDPGAEGDYEYFIGPEAVFDALTGDDKVAACCAHWKVDEANGIADPAKCVISSP